ncbi:hypothetical protein [Psychromonas sp.]|uniref:hypothetical protein n=1 Tax=Psychromonas sp. TaxID=1884585 RepID=UPI00356609F0
MTQIFNEMKVKLDSVKGNVFESKEITYFSRQLIARGSIHYSVREGNNHFPRAVLYLLSELSHDKAP